MIRSFLIVSVAALLVGCTSAAPTPSEGMTADGPVTAIDPGAEIERAADEAKRTEEKRKGFDCLSAWDGSNRDLVAKVKEDLRDPDSFEHIETTIAPVTAKGRHPIRMKYRAKNGFGGYNVEETVGAVDPVTCEATIIASPQQLKQLL